MGFNGHDLSCGCIQREYEELKVRLVAEARKKWKERWVMHDGTRWLGNNIGDQSSMIQI